MIIPSIDLQSGRAVQLRGGEGEPLVSRDPYEMAELFSVLPEVALIDLDAALGQGSNTALIYELIRQYPHVRFRVGGGMRTVDQIERMLVAGASTVIIGTAASPRLLKALAPVRERIQVALDVRNEVVQVEGWAKSTGQCLWEMLEELAPHAGSFLITDILREGSMEGVSFPFAEKLCNTGHNITVAGGVRNRNEIRSLTRQGFDIQMGMALYTGHVSLGHAFASTVFSELERLIPTIVQDELGEVLGLVYSKWCTLRDMIDQRKGIYYSRTRGRWEKGQTSGHTQELVRVRLDCDEDALVVTVRQKGVFCHTGSYTCFGKGSGLGRLERTIRNRLGNYRSGSRSYTRELLSDPALLGEKLVEEARELGEDGADIVHEAADVLYHLMVRLAATDTPLEQVLDELDRRART